MESLWPPKVGTSLRESVNQRRKRSSSKRLGKAAESLEVKLRTTHNLRRLKMLNFLKLLHSTYHRVKRLPNKYRSIARFN